MFIEDPDLNVMKLFGGVFEVSVVNSLFFWFLNILTCAVSVIGLALTTITAATTTTTTTTTATTYTTTVAYASHYLSMHYFYIALSHVA
jgi:hypothetical protein